jgi:hypothetical protein
MFDIILEYPPNGPPVEHKLSKDMLNTDRLRLFGQLVGGETCGLEFDKVNVYVKCDASKDTDALNEPASDLCGVPVYGTAIVILNSLVAEWNA